jgi:hypothetical protein
MDRSQMETIDPDWLRQMAEKFPQAWAYHDVALPKREHYPCLEIRWPTTIRSQCDNIPHDAMGVVQIRRVFVCAEQTYLRLYRDLCGVACRPRHDLIVEIVQRIPASPPLVFRQHCFSPVFRCLYCLLGALNRCCKYDSRLP